MLLNIVNKLFLKLEERPGGEEGAPILWFWVSPVY
jgi:hypothetical protein